MSSEVPIHTSAPSGAIHKTRDIISSRKGIIMSIGKRIRSLRKELELTQNQFGEELGIHGRQLARYEEGINTPSITTLMKIADHCEVSLDYLAYGHDKKIAKRAKISDLELLDTLRRIDQLKKPQRDKVKWAIDSLLNNKT